MPDRRKHRGKHPQDDELFASDQLDRLRTAVADHSWLLTRGYATDSSLKLVGDRFNLTARQRLAVQRSSCADEALELRASKCRPASAVSGQRLAIDGYNLLIIVESALSGGVLLIGRDGAMRDLAGIHGTYRRVEETGPALRLIMDHVESLQPAAVDWFLDRPVSNSGRLKKLMAELLEQRRLCLGGYDLAACIDSAARAASAAPTGTWNIELVDSPDKTLIGHDGVVVSSDSVVLDGCARWVNLARELIARRAPNAWVVGLAPT